MRTSLKRAMCRRIGRKVNKRRKDGSFDENSFIYTGDWGLIQRNKANGDVLVSNRHGVITLTSEGSLVDIRKNNILSSRLLLLRRLAQI